MVFVSATRLRVKSIKYLFPFFIANEASVKQLKKTKGFLGGKEVIDKNLTFWTVTMWNADSDMKEFRNSAPHRKAMQKLPDWCDEASYVHYDIEKPELPDMTTIYTKMITQGVSSKVRNPSPNQLERNYPPIKREWLSRNL